MPDERIERRPIDEERIAQLRALFPEVFVEGRVDPDRLRALLDDAEAPPPPPGDEHYGLRWPGKAEARKKASLPPSGTLRPCPGDGLEEDSTENLLLVGDNLEVLRLLQKSYAGKVKLIYIDPPYNTGKDFIYKDDFSESVESYLEASGEMDMSGLLVSNPKSAGRFHSRWLSMIYPRLLLARELLRQDGAVFVSIDDNEVHNARHLLDEVFGQENFLVQFAWLTDGNFDNQAKFKRAHEYVLGYARSEPDFLHPPVIDPSTPPDSKLFRPEIRNTIVKNGPKNPVTEVTLPAGFPSSSISGCINARDTSWPHFLDDAVIADSRLQTPVRVSSGWSSLNQLTSFIAGGFAPILDSRGQETTFELSHTGALESVKKRSDVQSHVISAIQGLGGPQKASSALSDMGIAFDYPKPVPLISYLIQMTGGNDTLCLDFFAGSGTTGEAVMRLNAEDGGKRRFILVQLDEPTKDPKYPTIADITTSRLKASAHVIGDEQAQLELSQLRSIDLGFRVFCVDRSNVLRWAGDAHDDPSVIADLFEQQGLRKGWAPSGLITEVALLEGYPLEARPEQRPEFIYNTVYRLAALGLPDLLACFDAEVDDATVEALVAHGDAVFVCLDRALSDSRKLVLRERVARLRTL